MICARTSPEPLKIVWPGLKSMRRQDGQVDTSGPFSGFPVPSKWHKSGLPPAVYCHTKPTSPGYDFMELFARSKRHLRANAGPTGIGGPYLGISVTSLTVLPSTGRLTEPQQMVQRRCLNAWSGDASRQVTPTDPRPTGETLDLPSEHATWALSTLSYEHVRPPGRQDLGRGQSRKVQNRNKVKIQQE